MNISIMKEDDYEAIREVEGRAWDSKGRRDIKSIQAGQFSNPLGCFVARVDEEIVGFIFSWVWGKIGWIGTFSVLQEYRGKHIGRKLLLAARDQLEEIGCTTIGLETMLESSYNVGLYLSEGFHLINPTVRLKKELSGQGELLSAVEPSAELIADICYCANPDLDLFSQVQSAQQIGWGETFLFENYGFVVLPDFKGAGFLPILYGATRNSDKDSFEGMITALESHALAKGHEGTIIAFNAENVKAIEWLISRGYRIDKSLIRMIYKGDYKLSQGFDISGWAM